MTFNSLFVALIIAITLDMITSSWVALPVALCPSLSETTTKVSAIASVPPVIASSLYSSRFISTVSFTSVFIAPMDASTGPTPI